MALYPAATQLLIPPGANDPKITARAVVLHVDAGNASSLYTYFRDRSGGLESHFYVKVDGSVEQYRDTAYQADAAFASNDFAIQIETQGYGEGSWTTQQIESIQRLLIWCNQTHHVPLVRIPSAYGSGVGYHCQWPSWNRSAHSCPGPNRVRQFENTLVPWMASYTAKPTRKDYFTKLAFLRTWRTQAYGLKHLKQALRIQAMIDALRKSGWRK